MEQLDDETNSSPSAKECAALVMDVVPSIMRTIRGEIRRHRPSDLSVPQFRALAIVNRHQSISISDVAEHLGLTLPSASKTVDMLVKRGLMERETAVEDRRRAILSLTESGRATLESSRAAALTRIAQTFSNLSESERKTIICAMESLRSVSARGVECSSKHKVE